MPLPATAAFVHLRYRISEGGTQCACNASRDTQPDVYAYA